MMGTHWEWMFHKMMDVQSMPEDQSKSRQPGATLTDSHEFIGNRYLCQASIPDGLPSFGSPIALVDSSSRFVEPWKCAKSDPVLLILMYSQNGVLLSRRGANIYAV